MQVKKVYMDLQEGVKKGNVWKLESEAFKKPIELQLHYDDSDLHLIEKDIEGLGADIRNLEQKISELGKENKALKDKQNHLLEGYMNNINHIAELADQIGEQNDTINELNKIIGNQSNVIEGQSGTILHLNDKLNEFEKKITKQPMVFNDKCFASGHERVGLGVIDIENGDYLLISKYTIGEHNEYVENVDELKFEKINVQDGYVPTYQLIGGTDVDTPTAMIYYNLVFIPIN